MVQHNYSTKPGTLETQSFERFQQFINGLDKVKEVVGDQIGLKRLDRLLELSGVYDRTPDTQPAFAKDNILSEVEAAGIQLNSTLLNQIGRSSLQEVRNAVDAYKKICKRETVKNPGGLFYHLLENQR
jgi:hypothetical protein